MGRDKQGQDYFSLAEQHFLWDSIEKTDKVVTSCYSLTDLLNYLNQNVGERAWGTIQVVLHGNVWSGLSIPMWQDGPRAYPKDLLQAVKQQKFPTLHSHAVDQRTRINLWACGIGKNPYLLIALERLFTNGEGGRPQVYASPHFVIFRRRDSGLPSRLKASYWPYFFRRGYRPSDSQISEAMTQQYPDVDINWSRVLRQESFDGDSSLFHHSFHVPIVWTVIYDQKDLRPDVSTTSDKMAWIAGQPKLQDKLNALGIPQERYQWTVNKIILTDPDGSIRYAIKAIGMCTVICFMHSTDDQDPSEMVARF